MTRCPTCGRPMADAPDPLLARLVAARHRAGLSGRAVGKLLDPPRTHAAISDIERGKTRLTVGLLRQFAVLYGTTAVALLGDEEDCDGES